jgi:uncharacterized membrane protein
MALGEDSRIAAALGEDSRAAVAHGCTGSRRSSARNIGKNDCESGPSCRETGTSITNIRDQDVLKFDFQFDTCTVFILNEVSMAFFSRAERKTVIFDDALKTLRPA